MTSPIVDAGWLKENFKNVKIIDATVTMGAKMEKEVFKAKYWADFELTEPAYESEHIAGAVHFNFMSAYYPSKFIKYDLYEPEIFTQYAQLLGINQNDHIVVYSRGPLAGVLFASRVLWTFKVYGFDKVSVLDGGLEAWKKIGGEVNSDKVTVPKGDVAMKSVDPDLLAKFEEIPFGHLQNTAYLDVRAAGIFNGDQPSGFPPTKGHHVEGALNFPCGNLVNGEGFKSTEEVDKAIQQSPEIKAKPVITACNAGIQASLTFVALLRSGIKAKVYNGSFYELFNRAPELINS